MTANENGPGAGHTGPSEKHLSKVVDSSDLALRQLENQHTAFNDLQASASRFGISVYPLDGCSILLTCAGGFQRCAPDLKTAVEVVRQFGAAHG